MEKKKYQYQQALSKIKECVEKENDFLITTHINPDGDSISSVLLFASILKHFGKRYIILVDDQIPEKFDFLSGISEIVHFQKEEYSFQPKVVVVLDASDLDRIGEIKEVIPSNAILINIDHHTSNVMFGKFNAIAPEKSSAIEIIYELFLLCEVPLSKEIATLVYTGIMCDTGRFLFPNTTYQSLSICAEMVLHGASPSIIARNIYQRMSPETLKALAKALSTLEFYFDGAVSSIYLPNDILSSNGKIDTEGFVDHLMAVEESEVQFFMVEKKPNHFRVSFRSKQYVDVNEVAKQFNGGGHIRAAGCNIDGTVDEVKNRILKVLKEHISNKK